MMTEGKWEPGFQTKDGDLHDSIIMCEADGCTQPLEVKRVARALKALSALELLAELELMIGAAPASMGLLVDHLRALNLAYTKGDDRAMADGLVAAMCDVDQYELERARASG